MTTNRATTSSTDDPAAYVAATFATLGERDPTEVMPELLPALREVVAMHPRAVLERPEAPGKWSVLQAIQHLADVELVFGWRVRQILTKDRPTLQGMDETAWMTRLRTGDHDLDAAMQMLSVLRQEHLRLWGTVTPAELERVGLHEERGEQTLRDWLRTIAGHDLIHRRQIRRILETVA